MKKVIFIMFVGLTLLSSCGKNEECVCDNSANLTESDAKDAGVSLGEACELAKNGDATCNVE
jgi:hypothetical protein